MNEVVMLEGSQSQQILRAVIDRKIPAIVSYLSKDKWHVAKVTVARLDATAGRLYLEGSRSLGRLLPLNIRIGQPVGVSFKYGHGKFVFDTTVLGLEPSSEPTFGGTIVLAEPHRIGLIQRRSYFRVNVPRSLKVNVVFWHRKGSSVNEDHIHTYSQGRLMDISAGGAQIVVSTGCELGRSVTDAPDFDFKKGQFIGLRFTPLPYETPLMFNAQIRNILPTVDETALCLGLQIVGLEASAEGRQTLARIASVVEQYHQINNTPAGHRDINCVPTATDSGVESPDLSESASVWS
jgi:hypothetical protein